MGRIINEHLCVVRHVMQDGVVRLFRGEDGVVVLVVMSFKFVVELANDFAVFFHKVADVFVVVLEDVLDVCVAALEIHECQEG